MTLGYLALVLHAHLPYVRHPEHPRPLEERWLYEALTECYLPLLSVFDRLERDRVPFALTMSLTPPLASMLRDDLLRQRFHDHLSRLEELAAKEAARLSADPDLGPVARFYVEYLQQVRARWDAIQGDVVSALLHHRDAGRIELLTSSATHAYLPGLLPAHEGIRAQLRLGMRAFEEVTGRKAAGIWLPECAYDPDFDEDLREAGVRYTLLDSHGITLARPRPPFGTHAPIASPSGVVFFGRDRESSRQVWSRHEGYPGDAYYRDFYRDVGFELPEEALGEEIGPFGVRIMTGLKFHRITGPTDDKQPYIPGAAHERAETHAGHFLDQRIAQVKRLAETMPAPPIVVAPYDAELFGHWWFEGPIFLEHFFRHLDRARKGGETTLDAVTLGQYLDLSPVMVQAMPAASSWGAEGFGAVWVGPKSAHLWRHVHHATRYASFLVSQYRGAEGDRGRALDQLVRELLLAQSSDWAFILTTGTVSDYAEARVRAHVHRLRHLGWLIEKDELSSEDRAWLDDLCARDRFLAELPSEALRGAFD